MELKDLIGEATAYDKKADQRAGSRAFLHLRTAMAGH